MPAAVRAALREKSKRSKNWKDWKRPRAKKRRNSAPGSDLGIQFFEMGRLWMKPASLVRGAMLDRLRHATFPCRQFRTVGNREIPVATRPRRAKGQRR